MSEFYGQTDDAESIRTIHRALALGCTLLDTADMYGPFINEELVGRAIADRRDQAFVASKFGIVRDPANPTARGVNGKPDYVKRSCENSLKRLGIDTIDLYQLHRVDRDTPIEETVGAMSELVREGKVRAIGLSEASAATLRRAHAVHPITSVQSEYSLWSRDPEVNGVFEVCAELGIGFLAYSPLGRGFLSGQIRQPGDFELGDYRRSNPRFMGENFAKNLMLVDKLTELARNKGVEASQLALAFCLARAPFVVPIPGTKRIKYLEQNWQALNIKLSDDDLRALDEILPVAAAHGDRYMPAAMATLNV